VTVGGALRAAIVAAGVVGGKVWRDRAPDGAAYPYVTFVEPVSDAPALSGDREVLARRMMVQVDLWQSAPAEQPALLSDLLDAIDGVRLSADRRTWLCRVVDIQRLVEPDAAVVHHAFTVIVTHA
jgi:hypothetical protein